MNRIAKALRTLFGMKRKYTKRSVKEKTTKRKMSPYTVKKFSIALTERNKARWARMKSLGITSGKLLPDQALSLIQKAREDILSVEKLERVGDSVGAVYTNPEIARAINGEESWNLKK